MLAVAAFALVQIRRTSVGEARAAEARAQETQAAEARAAERDAWAARYGGPHPDDVPLGYYVGRSDPAGPPAAADPVATTDMPPPAPPPADPPGTIYALAPDGRSVELRAGRSLPEGPELARIPHGAALRVIGSCHHGDTVDGVAGHWCAVEYGGLRGWAFDAFLGDPP